MNQVEEQIRLQQQLVQLENLARQYMTSDALQRYGNLKIAHPEKAIEVIMLVAQLVQNGQIRNKIDDETLKDFLLKTQKPKKEFKFLRK